MVKILREDVVGPRLGIVAGAAELAADLVPHGVVAPGGKAGDAAADAGEVLPDGEVAPGIHGEGLELVEVVGLVIAGIGGLAEGAEELDGGLGGNGLIDENLVGGAVGDVEQVLGPEGKSDDLGQVVGDVGR